ncbi:MAG: ATP phosphoribosyltransferase regulatory subunit [Candidatus Gracilibacteria bacterium]|nr:ATP phosphoribosyltransferase regulatory subunit [Candidatus Gracilibacteria bacterium]
MKEDKTDSVKADYLPEDHDFLTYVKKVFRHRCRQAGFRRITTALIEKVEDCTPHYADETILKNKGCIVECLEGGQKGIFKFDPVFSVSRAYVKNNMKDMPQPVELYQIEKYINKDESGEMNERMEFGLSVLGADDPALDAQIIYLASKILDDLGLKEHYTLQINYIGSEESRSLYIEDLKNFYFDKQRSMPEDALRHYEEGDFLQLLRNEDEDMQILAQLAPKLEHYLTEADQERYKVFKEYLDELEVSYNENKAIFGGGNFNANTVFEFWHNDKGSKNCIMYGGSNDEIIEKLGGEKTNYVGLSSDVEMMIGNMKDAGIRVPHKDDIQVFVAQLGKNAKKKALSLLERIREAGIHSVGAMGTGSMRAQLDMATSFNVKYALLMGEVEVKDGMVIVRDMSIGTQESVPYNKAIEMMIERVGKEKVDVMTDAEKSQDLKDSKKKK